MAEHKNLCVALLAFKAEAPALKPDKTNPAFRSKFVSLDAIGEKIDPLLTKHGLVWATMPGHYDGHPTLEYRLTHAPSGEAFSGSMPLLLDKQNSQGFGSAITYARRYAKTAVLDLIAEEDDDGAAASKPRPAPARAPQPPGPTAEDVAMLKTAAKGLTAEQIKVAFGACKLPIPDPFVAATVFMRVPQHKAVELYTALGKVRGEEKAA